MLPLPIDPLIPDILAQLSRHHALVLRAATGAGKTTRVPRALVKELPQGLVILVEPRRVAVRAAARRMAAEDQTELGNVFGYQVRFERKASKQTRCLAVTPGILLRMLKDDPYLEQVACVVFDEFHERGIEADLALGMIRLIREIVRPELKVVVMSATIDTEAISAYLGNCPTITSDGRLFPVEVHYRPCRPEVPWEDALAAVVEEALTQNDGGLLLFLPGLREIQRTIERLQPIAQRNDCSLMPLHGDLPPEQQDRALEATSQRKIVVASNVAEASVTVEGISIVIDTGTAKVQEFDPNLGMDRLVLRPISRASADQRKGRAGRLRPGVCYRLWDEASQRARPEQQEPEIRRVDLASACLQLIAFGEADLTSFPWIDPPRPESVEQAKLQLQLLGAYSNGQLTSAGKQLARLPVHPRLGRLILEGQAQGVLKQACLAAAILSERDPFHRDANQQQQVPPTDSDLADRIHALLSFSATGRTQFAIGHLHAIAARNILNVARQFENLLTPRDQQAANPERALRTCIFHAYADRLVRTRPRDNRRGVLLGGRGVKLAPSTGVQAELLVAIDLELRQPESIVRLASAIDREDLSQEWITTNRCVLFNEVQGRVEVKKRTMFQDLILDEVPSHFDDDLQNQAAELLAHRAWQRWAEIQPEQESEAGQLLLRLQCLRTWRPDYDLPSFDGKILQEILTVLATRCVSLAELKDANWHQELLNQLTYQQRQYLDEAAPTHWQTPSGSKIRLQYVPDKPPILAVRIQELFGVKQTPSIAGGRVRLLLHLLAPNGRPQQITDDLASFWANGYPVVRKELRGRYPKHSWPEDPLTAEPLRGAKPRTS